MSTREWKIGIVGLGSIADFHIQAIREIPNAKLAGVMSRREERAKEVAEQEENCFWTTDLNELLQKPEIDLICLTTSSGSHYELGKKVLQAGKHLLVEKPICMLPQEAEDLIELAKQFNVKLGVISQRRFEEHIGYAKQLLDEGALGKLLYVEAVTPFYRTQEYYDSAEWRGTYAEDGGALMNQGIHQIDLLLWFGGKANAVYGKTATQVHEMEAEDLGLAVVQFDNGALGHIMSSTNIQPGLPPMINIYGEKGTIKFEAGHIVHWTVPNVPMPEQEERKEVVKTNDPRNISHNQHRLQIINFIESIEQDKQPAVTGEDGRDAVKLINAIYESSKTGKEISL